MKASILKRIWYKLTKQHVLNVAVVFYKKQQARRDRILAAAVEINRSQDISLSIQAPFLSKILGVDAIDRDLMLDLVFFQKSKISNFEARVPLNPCMTSEEKLIINQATIIRRQNLQTNVGNNQTIKQAACILDKYKSVSISQLA